MKKKLRLIITLISGMIVLVSCQNPMTIETEVHDDGSLDKTITFEKVDSLHGYNNIFAISSEKGWSIAIKELADEKEEKFQMAFKKHFASADEVNAELNTQNDSLFNIKSSFEKEFRWFYTYIRYTETYAPLNRFKMISPDDYINAEDKQFIDRLPGEGNAISKADSLYLQLLHAKVDEVYSNEAIFNEQYDILVNLVKRNGIDPKWLDTVAIKINYIKDHIPDMRGDPDFALKMADSIKIPLDRKKAKADSRELSGSLRTRLNFMSFARDGRYTNIINMPWELVSTNADSVSGNKAFWRPLSTKFLFKEYVMVAESRKLNTWAVIVSVAFILLTVFVVWRRSKRSFASS
jgi:hypothetical protein